jgi:hypothetical protein
MHVSQRPGGEPLWRVPKDLLYLFQCSIRPEDVATGGSREVPSATYLPMAFDSSAPRPQSCESMGRSREPPLFARFGRTSDETKRSRVASYAPKRLPSGRWEKTCLVAVPTLRGRGGRRGRERRKSPYPCNNNLVGSSIQSLTRTRKVTASLPSTTRWS